MDVTGRIQGAVESPEQDPQSARMIIRVDTHVILDGLGNTRAVYRKLHLFDVALGVGNTMNESEVVEKGSEVPLPVETPIGKLGLSIVSVLSQSHTIVLRHTVS